jgi:hypothetical protein
MTYRDAPQASLPTDPLARFLELHRAFDVDRGLFGDRVPLRLAAIALITAPGSAAELAATVRGYDAELDAHFPWHSSIAGAVRLVLAAALVRTGERPADFLAAVDRGRSLMRAAKLPRGEVHETLAILALRRVVAPRELDGVHIDRVRSIYEEMKRSHWFLTGADDLTACAMLHGRSGTAQQICAHIDVIYDRLADAPKVWGGDPLQTAANVLGLLDVPPEAAAQRFLDVATALRDAGVKVRQSEYDDVAVLSFVPQSAASIARTVETYVGQLHEALGRMWGESPLPLAASLTFVRMLGEGAHTGTLADAKLLLEMQSIVSMRQAAAMAAVAAT